MRKHILIVILVILLLFPISTRSANAIPVQYVQTSITTYNFSGYSVGAYPVNKTWITFSTINNGSYFNDQVTSTSLGNGLDVFTTDQSQSSYLEINVSTFSRLTLNINFSWNSYGYYGFTQDNMEFYSGSNSLFGLSFGPLKSFDTYLTNASGSWTLGSEPTPYSEVTLSVSFNSSTPGIAEMSIKEAGQNITAFPVKVGFKSPLGSALSIRIGGMYSNETLYSISEDNSAPGNLSSYAGRLSYNNTSFSTVSGFAPDASSVVTPFMDSNLNSVIYYSSNDRIVSYDYYNSSFHNVSGNFPNLSGGMLFGGSIIYWQMNGSLKLYRLEPGNLSISELKTGIVLSGQVYALFSGPYVLFYNLSGAFAKYDFSSNSTTDFSVSDYGTNLSGFRILTTSLRNSTLSVNGYSNSTRHLFYLKFNFTSLSLTSEHETNFSFLTDGITPESYGQYDSGLTSMFNVSDNLTQSYLESQGGNIYSSPGNTSFESILFSSSSYSLVLWQNSIYILSSDGSLRDTGAETSSTHVQVSADSNLSHVLILSNSEINVFYSGSSLPLSTSQIRISGKPSYLLRGMSYVNITVESSLYYTIRLQTYNLSVELQNSTSFHINSSYLPGGVNTAFINATNRAGFTSTIVTELDVDNAVPDLKVSNKNGSYISSDAMETYAANDSLGVKSVNISYLSENMTFTSANGTFFLDSGNRTGMVNLSIQVVDGFGLKFSFSYTYDVIGLSLGTVLNVGNGEYLNSTTLNLSWPVEENATQYTVFLTSSNKTKKVSTDLNHTLLNLVEGYQSIRLNATLLDGNEEILTEVNVTVIAYSPAINISGLPSGVYSFFGNSNHDVFSATISTNITATLQATITGPGRQVLYNLTSENSLLFNTSSILKKFNENGNYSVSVSATSLSGTESDMTFHIMVNNTIPSSPVLNGTAFYTNMSVEHIGLNAAGGTYYSAVLLSGSKKETVNYTSLNDLHLPFGTGEYTLNVTADSISGNHNYSMARIYYYTASPEVKYSLTENLTIRNYTFFNYTVSDNVPVKNVTLVVNGTAETLQAPNGSVRIVFQKNGIYNISLQVSDLSGNRNTTGNDTVTVSYYIHLISPEIESYKSGGIWHFSLSSRGNGLSRVQVEWYINGKPTSDKLNFTHSLGYGSNTITAMIKYQGKSEKLEKKIMVVGLIPYIAIPGAIASFMIYRTYGTNRDADTIRQTILGNIGRPVKDAIAEGRHKRIPSGRIKNQIQKLQKEGKISIGRDPDRKEFIMPPGKNRD